MHDKYPREEIFSNQETFIIYEYNQLDNEKELFFNIFSIIGEEVLGYCYSEVYDNAKENNQDLPQPSNYLKSDNNYYKDIIKRLWSRYNKNTSFKNDIDTLCKPY